MRPSRHRRLTIDAETRQIPIIALTEYAMEDDRKQALAAGCDEYFTKPPDFKRLQEMVETLLQRTPPPNR